MAFATSDREHCRTGVVLLVEDEDVVRRVTTRMLEGNGFRVIEARTGSEALDLLGTLKVQLVVSDIALYGMSGFDLADLMAAHWADVPLLLMSGHAKPLGQYGDRFLAKPFTAEALLDAVEALVKHESDAPGSPQTVSSATAAARPRRA
jgi:CheY-like chemotaxis protein